MSGLVPLAECSMVTASGRPCGRGQHRLFGGIPVCWQHFDSLENAAYREVAFSEDESTAVKVLQALHRRNARRSERSITYRPQRSIDRHPHEGFVYYAERGGYIKIGFALVVANRLRDLERGGVLFPPQVAPGPLRLLVAHRGGRPVEQAMHHRFAPARVVGEWFRPTPDLCDHIAALARRQSRSDSARGVITYTRRLAAMSPAS